MLYVQLLMKSAQIEAGAGNSLLAPRLRSVLFFFRHVSAQTAHDGDSSCCSINYKDDPFQSVLVV